MSIGIDLSIGAGRSGGSVNTGVLQMSGGAPLSGTLQTVVDQNSNASTLQLSTSQAAITQSGINRLLIATDITMRRNDNTLFLNYSNAPDILELNGNTLRLNNLRGNTVIGHTAASARLHVRGDGTNPIARFESSAGASTLQFSNDGTFHQYGSNGGGVGLYISTPAGAQSVSGTSLVYYSNVSNSAGYGFRFYGNAGHTYTGGTGGMFTLGGSYNSGAGSANYRPLFVEYTINTTGAQTGTATGIFLNATETALNGMAHNLIDLQVGGASRFLVTNGGTLTITGNIQINGGVLTFSSLSRIQSNINGNVILYNNAQTDFGRLQLGGTTNLFPSIKRNGQYTRWCTYESSACNEFCD